VPDSRLHWRLCGALAALALTQPIAAAGQTPPEPPAAQQDETRADDRSSRARRPDPLEPDFMLVNLPTSLALPKFRSAFRVTHRFGRPLGEGDFGDLVSDLFGIDGGAIVGLEYRFGIWDGAQVGVYRTSDRTIELFGEYALFDERDGAPIGVSAWASIDGTDNFRDSYSPALGAILSKRISRFALVYFEPIWVNNSNPLPAEGPEDNDSFLLGVGGRIRIRPTVYLVGEIVPRVGFDPGVTGGSFAIEKRAGGHVFQLNFSNTTSSTIGQLTRGGISNDTWFLGFNISRKFY
jgi:Membrane bound beta barrel domain (DUF5777)